MCAVTARSSGEIKDQEILKENRPLRSFRSASLDALDKNIPMLFLIVLLIWHGYYKESYLYKILACLNYL